jgi:hypothetical protein
MKSGPLLIVLLVAGGCAKPVPAPTSAPATRAEARPKAARRPAPRLAVFDSVLRIGLEQEGRAVRIDEHEASLRKGPFEILITTQDATRGILMNVSLKPELYERARRGQDLEGYFQPGTGMAEEAVVKKKELYVSDFNSHHYLLHNPEMKTNRYHEVRKTEDGFRCRRSVEQLYLVPSRKTIRIADLGHDALYLVFFLGLARNDRSVEQERGFVKIRFH